jgi:hypothetical protein
MGYRRNCGMPSAVKLRRNYIMQNPMVKLVQIENAKGVVQEVFEEMQEVRGPGRVSNLFKGYAIWPELLRVNWDRMKVVMGGGSLSRKVKEAVMIALAEINRCEY